MTVIREVIKMPDLTTPSLEVYQRLIDDCEIDLVDLKTFASMCSLIFSDDDQCVLGYVAQWENGMVTVCDVVEDDPETLYLHHKEGNV